MILDISAKFGRKVALIGRSMNSATEIAHSLGLLDIPDGLLIRPQDTMQTAPHKLTVLISGTQGEPMSALSRVAVDNHKHITVEKGDMVALSSRIIPGNEKAIFRMIDHMARRGADVMYGSMNPPLHVSGQRPAAVEELTLMLNLVRPKYFVPVHGEYRQLAKHRRLAERFCGTPGLKESFVLETGHYAFENRRKWRSQRREGDYGPGLVHRFRAPMDEVVEDLVIHRSRRHLSEDGIVLPIIAINKLTGRAETLPEIVTRGFSAFDNGDELIQASRQVVVKTLETSSPEELGDWGVMKEKIRADLKRYIAKQTQRRPLIMPVILEV